MYLMTQNDIADRECEAVQKQQGPGGQFPANCYYAFVQKAYLDDLESKLAWKPIVDHVTSAIIGIGCGILTASVAGAIPAWVGLGVVALLAVAAMVLNVPMKIS